MTRRILLICHGYPFERIGGVGQVIDQLTSHLPQLGWEVHVLVPKMVKHRWQSVIRSHPEAWGTVHTLQRSIGRWSQSWKDRNSENLLLDWATSLAPDCIHIHHLNALPLQWLLDYKRIQNPRLWLTLHDYAIPCLRGQLLDHNLHLCLGPNAEKCTSCIDGWLHLDGWKRVGTRLHHTPIEIVEDRIQLAKNLLESMDYIDAPSQSMQTSMRAMYPDLDIQFCDLPIAPFVISRSISRDMNTHRFLFVGSIHPSKGLHIVLQAFAKLLRHTPNIALSIIGHTSPSDTHPNYSQNWTDFAQQFPEITWLGTLSHDSVLQQMETHHTLVLPSVWKENSPIVVREALQRGMHVICGRGGSKELSPTIHAVSPLSVYEIERSMSAIIQEPPSVPAEYPDPRTAIQKWIANALPTKPLSH